MNKAPKSGAAPPAARHPDGPPVFEIASRDWWFKVIGMLKQNWALLEQAPSGTVTAYFFHDEGKTLGSNGKKPASPYRWWMLYDRVAVVDSIPFPTREVAEAALRRNRFELVRREPGPWSTKVPRGEMWDARRYEGGVYSQGGYWIPE
jgi:hypothetical protein